MRRPRETINAAVLATAVWIDACFEANIGTLIARDNRFGCVAKILGAPAWPFNVRAWIVLNYVGVTEIDMQFLKSVGRTPRSATAMNRGRRRRRFIYNGILFAHRLSPRHMICSHEH